MRTLALVALASLLACAPGGRWRSQPAPRAATPTELGAWPVSFAPHSKLSDPALADRAGALRAALGEAMARHGFKLVDPPPKRGDLEVWLGLERAGGSPAVYATATLRSDGFYVSLAEEQVPAPDLQDVERLKAVAEALAAQLVRTEGLAFFIRNGGTPAQTVFTN